MYISQGQRGKLIILVLFVDDILLASDDTRLLNEKEHILSKTFNINDLCEASFVLDTEIQRVRPHGIVGIV